MHNYRDAGGGGARGARAPPSFGISVNPIRTKGADYARHITTVPLHHLEQCGVSDKQIISIQLSKIVFWSLYGLVFFSRNYWSSSYHDLMASSFREISV